MALQIIGKGQIGGVPTEIKADIKRLKRQLRAFQVGIPRAYRNALNTSATAAKKEALRILSKKFAIKQKDLRKFLTVDPRANPKYLDVALRGRSKRLSIYKYSRTTARQGTRGAIFNSGSGQKTHPNTFIATMQSGHTGIFVRKTARRTKKVYNVSPTTGRRYLTHLPIRELTYPSVASMIVNKDTAPKIVGAFNAAMRINYVKKLNDQVEKAKARGLV